VVDTVIGSVVTMVPTPAGGQTLGLVVTPDGSKVYVTHYASASKVSVISTATNTVTTTVDVGVYPWGITVAPDGSRVYVANQLGQSVSVIDTATDTVVATIGGFATRPIGMSPTPDGSRIYVAAGTDVNVVSTATNTITATIPVGIDSVAYGRFILPPAVCGNGVVQPGEQCDDGNTTDDDGCDGNCTFTGCGNGVTTSGEQCDDGNLVAGDCCSPTCLYEASGDPCADDGSACTRDECDGAGLCTHPNEPAGTACPSDGNVCTDDVCDGAGACTHPPNAASCDDGLFCNGADTCSGGACTDHRGDPCAGGGECADACNEAADDCIAAAATPCTSDGNVCTDDVCDGAGACIHPVNTAPCDDGLFCNGADTCSGGACTDHAGDPCAGGGACADACNEAADSCFEPDGTPCSDGLYCNGADTCAGGACADHGGDPCPGPDGDGNCAESCDEALDSCTAPDPDGATCNDGLFCTVSDACQGGACGGGPRDCSSDAGSCVVGSCDEATDQCIGPPVPDGTPCEDGDACTTGELCTSGACGGGTLDPSACLDHYLCYRAQVTLFSGGFTRVPGVGVADELEVGTVELKKPKTLCPPANKNGEGIRDPALLMESYLIGYAPQHIRRSPIEMTDQFGTLLLDTIEPDRLLVPTTIGFGGPPAPPPADAANHYKCYRVKTTLGTPKFPKDVQVSVADQFETRLYDVKKPRRLCVPVDKNGEGIPHPAANVMCYQVKRASGQPKHARIAKLIHTANQFGTGRLDTIQEEELCVPALKRL
jgi:YVTN family beta-propeller protein/cysteine-rich repeat protein